MRVLVTGATGHIGNNLVRVLLERGHRVRALVHRNRLPLEGLDIELVGGNLLDPQSLQQACRDMELVFHLAGLISILESDAQHLERINLQGTRNVLEACREAGVRRLVYTSSVEALLQPGGADPVDENIVVDPAGPWSAYSRTKYLATQEVFRAAAQGLDAVVVYPTAVVGPGDWRPSLLGETIIAFAHRRLPALVAGGFDFVDVRDVVAGLLAAAERGRSGRGYLLGGQYLTTGQMAAVLERCTGVPRPRLLLPNWLAGLAARLAPPFYRLSGRPARFTPQSLRMLADGRTVLHRRAHDELGYLPRRAEHAFAGAVDWFARQGRLRRVFRSQRELLPVAGFVLFFTLCVVCGLFGLLATDSGDGWWGLGALLTGLAYLAISWPVRYEIGRQHLHVRSGLLHLRIRRNDIVSSEPSRLPLSAPAWSWRRLRIEYRNGDKRRAVLIAPERRQEFLRCLQTWPHDPPPQVSDDISAGAARETGP